MDIPRLPALSPQLQFLSLLSSVMLNNISQLLSFSALSSKLADTLWAKGLWTSGLHLRTPFLRLWIHNFCIVSSKFCVNGFPGLLFVFSKENWFWFPNPSHKGKSLFSSLETNILYHKHLFHPNFVKRLKNAILRNNNVIYLVSGVYFLYGVFG